MIRLTFLPLLLVVLSPRGYRQLDTTSNAYVHNKDSLAISFLIQEFYQSLTFKEAELNKLDRLPKFFTPHAMMISNIGEAPEFSTVKEWVLNAKQGLKKQQFSIREEYELCANTQIFGKVVQRFSTYKIRIVANRVERGITGINAIQLIKQNNQWLITSVAWIKRIRR